MSGTNSHRQNASKALMTCLPCRMDGCGDCVDKIMLLLGRPQICGCERQLHDEKIQGEPRLEQIRDPVTGDVYAPGLVAKHDGGVKFHGEGD